MKRRAAALTLSLLALGCTRSVEPERQVVFTCTANALAAVYVSVVDSMTGAALLGTHIAVIDGAYQDTATHTDSYAGPYGLAEERPGTYLLNVSQPRYQPWERRGLAVLRDECHVIPVRLTVRLVATVSASMPFNER